MNLFLSAFHQIVLRSHIWLDYSLDYSLYCSLDCSWTIALKMHIYSTNALSGIQRENQLKCALCLASDTGARQLLRHVEEYIQLNIRKSFLCIELSIGYHFLNLTLRIVSKTLVLLVLMPRAHTHTYPSIDLSIHSLIARFQLSTIVSSETISESLEPNERTDHSDNYWIHFHSALNSYINFVLYIRVSL